MRSTKLPSWSRRLLGFAPLPSPPHAFLLGTERLLYGQLTRERGGLRLRDWSEVGFPADSFLNGPLGGPLRDPGQFRGLVGGLLRGMHGGVREASLVLPDAWLRVAFSESGELPSSGAARDEVLRWKLRRLVPFRVDELRVAAAEVAPLPVQQEPRRLLMGFAVELLLGQLEEAFAANGVRLGQISNTSLSLLPALELNGRAGGFSAVALVEHEGYTLVFARAGEPVLHRYKGLAGALPATARDGFVERDLKLTRTFLSEHFPGAGLTEVLLCSPPELEPAWLDRLERGLESPAVPLDGRHLPAIRGESLPPWRELAPLIGAVRREVL